MKVFNTLTGQKEEFVPSGDTVKMYVCGVTPYDECHVGHAMSYIIFDIIRRYLEYRGYRVKHVQNFTDIDDKIIARAQSLGILAQELADRFIKEYFESMDPLNIQRAHIYPRVTEEIPAIIGLIEALVDKGLAYESGGDVYFRVRSLPDYGKLSRRILDDMVASARVDMGAGKEHPMDFTLWKGTKPGEPQWESPWGPGRPGWHIECSAMSLKYLGSPLDIHGGGQDLIFPHHENEIAQSEGATGEKPIVRYWLHNGLLRMGEEKMSKSLGNVVTVKEVLSEYSSDALHLFVLSSHYRSPLTYTHEAMAGWHRGADRLKEALRPAQDEALRPPGAISESKGYLSPEPYRQRFMEAMDDDFNTSQAIATLFDLAREINRVREEGLSIAEAQKTLAELAGVLGLTLADNKEAADAAPFIGLLVEIRAQLRTSKEYSLADKIRAHLGELGIILEDTPQGTLWKRQ